MNQFEEIPLQESLLNFQKAACNICHIPLQVAQLSQRDRAAGWVSFRQKWKNATGRQYFADIIGLCSTSVT